MVTADENLPTALSCAGCTSQLTRFQTGLLEEPDSQVVSEHLDSCPNCRLFSEQLDAVADLIGSDEPEDLPENISALAAKASVTAQAQEIETASLLRGLSRLAIGLDPSNAEELVQQTFLAALEADAGNLDFEVLAQELTDRAIGDAGPTVRSLNEFLVEPSSLDVDSDAAELYYPDFYADGPEVGGHIDAPNRWGSRNTLDPDEDVVTAELYGVVDTAIAQLPNPQGQILQLVDFDGLTAAGAAAALRIHQSEAIDALHKARVHIRGAVDGFISP